MHSLGTKVYLSTITAPVTACVPVFFLRAFGVHIKVALYSFFIYNIMTVIIFIWVEI